MFGAGKIYDCCLEYFAFEVSINVPKEKNPGKNSWTQYACCIGQIIQI